MEWHQGCGDKYRGYLDSQVDPNTSDISKDIAAWKQKIEQLKADSQVVVGKPLQEPVLLQGATEDLAEKRRLWTSQKDCPEFFACAPGERTF